jgi:hypothetical protein
VEGTAESDDLDVVDRAVRLVSLEILVAILDGGDEDDDDQGQRRQTGTDSGESREELKDDEDCTRRRDKSVRRECATEYSALRVKRMKREGRETHRGKRCWRRGGTARASSSG